MDSLVGGEHGEGTESIPRAVEAVDVLTHPSSSLSMAASRLFLLDYHSNVGLKMSGKRVMGIYYDLTLGLLP